MRSKFSKHLYFWHGAVTWKLSKLSQKETSFFKSSGVCCARSCSAPCNTELGVWSSMRCQACGKWKKIPAAVGWHQCLKPYSAIPPVNYTPHQVPGFFVWQPGRLGKSSKRFAANIGDGAMGRACCENVLNLFWWCPEIARPISDRVLWLVG